MVNPITRLDIHGVVEFSVVSGISTASQTALAFFFFQYERRARDERRFKHT